MKKIVFFILFFFPAYAQDLEQHLASANKAMEEKNISAALMHLNRAYELSPHDNRVIIKLAKMHFYNFQFDTAIFYFEQFFKKNPHPDILFNLASLYAKTGQFDHAMKIYEQIPPDTQVNNELLKIYLRKAYWEKAQNLLNAPDYLAETINKKVLLELDRPGNGYGDAIQFLSIAKQLKANGAYVIVHVKEQLIPLLKNNPYIDEICSGERKPSAERAYDICIGSLMINTYKNSLHNNKDPYIFADNTLIQNWKQKLSHDYNFKIGICFESNLIRNQFTGEKLLSLRSITPTALKPLSLIPNSSFYSLQLFAHSEIPSWIKQFDQNFDKDHGRFMDTAAVMKNINLIITIDTSLAHLAGALGVPVWLLLSVESDYRWFLNRTDSPWYPTMRIFRQKKVGDWQPVIKEVAQELERIITL